MRTEQIWFYVIIQIELITTETRSPALESNDDEFLIQPQFKMKSHPSMKERNILFKH